MNQTCRNNISFSILNFFNYESDITFDFFQIFKNNKGTRFTRLGFEKAKKNWKYYTIALPNNYKILNRTLLLLDSRMAWPYYLSKTQLILFDDMDAFEFTLYNGDINLWSKNKE